MKFLLDPGHGGDKPGAVYGGVEEEDVTLAVAFRASNVLRGLGHDVYLTRDRDTGISLPERVRLMNEYRAEAFISIHCNAATDPRPHGVEAFYRDNDDELLARCCHDALHLYCGLAERGVHQDELQLKKRLAVLSNLTLPCSLVELGFLSNPDDRKYIVENINKLGEVLAHGIDWFSCIKGGVIKKDWPG